MQVYIGIDWSESQHDATFLNDAGAIITHLAFPHTLPGLLRFDEARQRLGVAPTDCLVGLETAHNLLIDFLWDRGYIHLFVVPPNVVKSSQGRYRQSGARSDPADSFILADYLRTTPQPSYPWSPDSPLTRQMRAQVSLLLDLKRDILRYTNRLRALLLRYHPAAFHVFSSLTTRISLHFIRTFPTPADAAQLEWEDFLAFARRHRYPNPARHLRDCFARLHAPYPQPTLETVQACQFQAVALASLLLTLLDQRDQAMRHLSQLFAQHPDAFIFDSLPGTGSFLAPALLVKFGDDRRRFPTPASVQALAGTAPVTLRSGKRKVVRFRKACDRAFRHIAQQWAIGSVSQSVWAQTYLEQALARHMSRSQAYRCLANRWLAIAWKLWQTRQAYDEAYHMKRWTRRRKPLV